MHSRQGSACWRVRFECDWLTLSVVPVYRHHRARTTQGGALTSTRLIGWGDSPPWAHRCGRGSARAGLTEKGAAGGFLLLFSRVVGFADELPIRKDKTVPMKARGHYSVRELRAVLFVASDASDTDFTA
jgi:hypothetical protein